MSLISSFSSGAWLSRSFCGLLAFALSAGFPVEAVGRKVFNIKNYGATGRKTDDARPAIQKAIDACAAAGGGVVLLPPGEYTSGTLDLRSHIRVHLEAGATLFATQDTNGYDYRGISSRAALFYGENLEKITIEGQGIVDGQAEYEWRPDDFERNYDHKTKMESLGKSLMRSVPKGFPKREVFPHLLWLGRCKDVKVTGLNFLHAPNWTISLYACDRVVFDQLYIYTSLKEAVWADGIDLDSCRDVLVANCVIETGDDCVALVSQNWWGPPRICENISITNCRLSSASAGVKFSEGNRAGVRNVQVSNTLFNNVNRGFVFCTAMGGSISNVTLSNLTINCNRFDWFWAGDGQPFRFRPCRLSELTGEPPEPGEAPPPAIRNITIRNVNARAKGSSLFYGHPENFLDGVNLENVKLFMATDTSAPYEFAEHALDFRHAKNVRLKDVEVFLETPASESWKSALFFEDVQRLDLDGFTGAGTRRSEETPVLALKQVSGANLRNCRALEGTDVFLRVLGPASRDIRLEDNHLGEAKVPVKVDDDVPASAVKGKGTE
jgi:hypothetical protein